MGKQAAHTRTAPLTGIPVSTWAWASREGKLAEPEQSPGLGSSPSIERTGKETRGEGRGGDPPGGQGAQGKGDEASSGAGSLRPATPSHRGLSTEQGWASPFLSVPRPECGPSSASRSFKQVTFLHFAE